MYIAIDFVIQSPDHFVVWVGGAVSIRSWRRTIYLKLINVLSGTFNLYNNQTAVNYLNIIDIADKIISLQNLIWSESTPFIHNINIVICALCNCACMYEEIIAFQKDLIIFSKKSYDYGL